MMSEIWIRHITHMWMRHVTHMNRSCHMNVLCHTHKWMCVNKYQWKVYEEMSMDRCKKVMSHISGAVESCVEIIFGRSLYVQRHRVKTWKIESRIACCVATVFHSYMDTYICVFIYVYICIHIHIERKIHIYIYIYKCIKIYVYMYKCIYVYMYIYIYTYIHMYIDVHTCTYLCLYVYMYTYLYMYVYACIKY